MGILLKDLGQLVGGEVCGDGETEITGAATLRDAVQGDITLADSAKFISQLEGSAATAVVLPVGLDFNAKPSLRAKNVHGDFAKIVRLFRPAHAAPAMQIHSAAFVAPTAKIGRGVLVAPHAYVGENVEIGEGCEIHSGARISDGCRIGNGVRIFSNAVLYEDTVVGDRTIIHANAVIGAFGFGYQFVAGKHQLSSQLGNVVIGCDVEIGACTTIDRGTYGSTVVGDGTKIDNLVMIGHNCRIGKHNLLCSQVGIAGSCSTGDYVVMAGQVGIKDHVHIADRAKLGAKSGVMRDIPSDCVFLGSPALPEREQLLIMATVAKLPELRKQVRLLEQQVAALSAKNEACQRSSPGQREAA